MAANPIPSAYVREIEITDSEVENSFHYVVIVAGLNVGPVQEDTLELDLANNLTKSQIKNAIDNAIIALFASAKGAALNAAHIFVLSDLAG